MLELLTLMNYVAWFVFAFIGVVWLLILLQHGRALGGSGPRWKGPLPFVSIIVPAYNEGAHVAACVRSLLALDYPRKRMEVIVVDDASADDTSAQARALGVRVVRNARNKGKAASLNRGIAVARGSLIATVDADSVVARSILKRMIGH